jgi:hypothetical protein
LSIVHSMTVTSHLPLAVAAAGPPAPGPGQFSQSSVRVQRAEAGSQSSEPIATEALPVCSVLVSVMPPTPPLRRRPLSAALSPLLVNLNLKFAATTMNKMKLFKAELATGLRPSAVCGRVALGAASLVTWTRTPSRRLPVRGKHLLNVFASIPPLPRPEMQGGSVAGRCSSLPLSRSGSLQVPPRAAGSGRAGRDSIAS